mgnify:CR=1 FL=1
MRTFDFIQASAAIGCTSNPPGTAVRFRAPRCRSPDGSTGATGATVTRAIATLGCAGKACAASAADGLAARSRPSTTAPAKAIVAARRRPLYTARRIEKPDRRCASSHLRRRRLQGVFDHQRRRLPPVEKPVETAQPAAAGRDASRIRPRTSRRIRRSATGRPKARERCGSRKCGNALVRLCARFIEREGRSDPDQHGSRRRKGNGPAASTARTAGETYYGTMSMKAINTLRVEACAFGRFYCSGNN